MGLIRVKGCGEVTRMYQALYRKWRPKVFEDVVGLDAVTTVLRHQVQEGTVSHAYLFTGSRGTGKTTCSKILAKAVNCSHPVNGNPCLSCDNCHSVENGSAVDVVEIDAASNNSVDNIRDLKEEALFTPVALRYRVYIIDEVHMLSIGAFNALLKLMEEPPPHVIFILATTEVHKIPATILSRCQRFDFGRIDTGCIQERIQYIAGQEQVSLTQEAASLIAKLADGGMRDALTLLDQCIAVSREVDGAVVAKVAGLAGSRAVFPLAQSLCRQDVSRALVQFQQLMEQSVDLRRLCVDLTACFRNLMILKTAENPEPLIPATKEEIEQLKEMAQPVSLSLLLRILTQLQELPDRLSKAASKRTEYEMALVRICVSPSREAVQAGSGELEAIEGRLRRLEQGRGREAAMPGPSAPSGTGFPQEDIRPATADHNPPENRPQGDLDQMPQVEDGLLEKFSRWEETLEKLGSINPPLRGTLQGSSAYVKDDILLVHCGNSLFLRLIREDDNAKSSLRRALYAVTGKKYRLGPYTREAVSKIAGKASPLDQVLHRAREAGVPVEES